MKAFQTTNKKTMVIMIGASTIVGVLLIWQFLIVQLQLGLQAKKLEIETVSDSIKGARNYATLLDKFTSDYELGLAKLIEIETSMVTQGDPYRWIINKLRELQQRNDVTVTDFERPKVEDWTMPPKPEGYQQATFTIRGTAHFHSFGSFLADVENELLFCKVKRVHIQASTGKFSIPTGNEKLVFEVQFVNPYKAQGN